LSKLVALCKYVFNIKFVIIDINFFESYIDVVNTVTVDSNNFFWCSMILPLYLYCCYCWLWWHYHQVC
jgi:hypothetical protein